MTFNRYIILKSVTLPGFHSRERLHARLAYNLLPSLFASAAYATALGRCALAFGLPSVLCNMLFLQMCLCT